MKPTNSIYHSVHIRSFKLFFFVYLLNLTFLSSAFYAQNPTLASLDTINVEMHSGDSLVKELLALQKRWADSSASDSILLLASHLERIKSFKIIDTNNVKRILALQGLYTSNVKNSVFYFQKAFDFGTNNATEYSAWMSAALGMRYNQLGDIEKSIYFNKTAVDIYAKLGKVELAIRKGNNLAIAYQTVDLNLSEQTYLRLISLAQKNNLLFNELFVRGNYASFLIENKDTVKFKVQMEVLQEQIKNIQELDGRCDIDELLYGNRAIYFSYKKEHKEAIKNFNSVFNAMDCQYENRFRREYAKVCDNISKEYLILGDYKNAKSYIEKGLFYLTRIKNQLFIPNELLANENTFIELYSTLSDIYKNQYLQNNDLTFLDSSLIALNKAIYVNDLLRNNYALDDSKLVSLQENRQYINKIIDIYDLLIEQGRVINDDQLLNAFSRSKGILLNEDFDRRNRYNQLDQKSKSTFNQNELEIVQLRSTNDSLAENRMKRILRLTDTNEKLLKDTASTISKKPLTDFVDFVVSNKSIYSLDDFTGKLRLNKLCDTKKFKDVWNELSGLLTSSNQLGKVNSGLSKMYHLILNPIKPLPKTFSVFPDNVLHFVPLEALINTKNKYLIEKHTIVLRYNWPTQSYQSTVDNRVFGIAPEYGNKTMAIVSERAEIGRLAFAAEEVNELYQVYESVSSESSLSLDMLASIMDEYDILHYAGHALNDDRTGHLVLNGNDSKNYYDKITGEEISALISNLNVAILSACQTGKGAIQEGEGVSSLARAFHQAGTKNVVSSIWNANDISAAKIMKSFHQHLADGDNSINSLRNAKKQYLGNAIGNDKHPYYWAGFVASTMEVIPKESNSKWWFLLLFIPLILIIIFNPKFKKS